MEQSSRIDLIVSQGRVADRTPNAIKGAHLTARALERSYGLTAQTIGRSMPAMIDDWRASLPQAKETLDGLRRKVAASIQRGRVPMVVANTCSASLASLPVVAQEYPGVVVLWIDAHGDFNTPGTTGTGYLGGMVLAAACGLWESGHGAGVRAENVVVVGARDIDEAEQGLLQDAGVRIIPPNLATPETILSAIAGSPVWVHLDWDALEPGFVPAAYEVPGGLLPSQVRAMFEALPSGQIVGIELAEFEAPADEDDAKQAVAVILDTVAPLFRSSRTS